MSGWITAAPVIKQLFSDLAVDAAKVTDDSKPFESEWHEGQRGAIHQEQKLSLLLKVTTVALLGEDERRDEFVEAVDDVPEHIVTTNWGERRVTLQVQAVVPERTDADWAMATIMRLMRGLQRRTSIDALLAVDVSLDEIGKAIKTPFKDAGRVVSAATMDVFLRMLDSEEDPSPLGWIETIELTSHVQATPGVDIPLPLQMDHEILPP